MDQAPLVMDEIEAGADLIREMSHHFPIRVAFWLKRDEDDSRTLYLASERFDKRSRPDAYGELMRIAGEKPSLFLDPFAVTLLADDDRFATAAKQINERYPDRLGTKLRSAKFGDRYIADAYIYPTPLTERFPRFA